MNLLPPDVGFGHDALKTIAELKKVFHLQRHMRDVSFQWEKDTAHQSDQTLFSIDGMWCDPFDLLVVGGITVLYPNDPVDSEHRAEAVEDTQQIEWDHAHEISLQPNKVEWKDEDSRTEGLCQSVP